MELVLPIGLTNPESRPLVPEHAANIAAIAASNVNSPQPAAMDRVDAYHGRCLKGSKRRAEKVVIFLDSRIGTHLENGLKTRYLSDPSSSNYRLLL
jgi:hypothetical protein